MEWARILAYVTGTVDQEVLAKNEYQATENQVVPLVVVYLVGARPRASALFDSAVARERPCGGHRRFPD